MESWISTRLKSKFSSYLWLCVKIERQNHFISAFNFKIKLCVSSLKLNQLVCDWKKRSLTDRLGLKIHSITLNAIRALAIYNFSEQELYLSFYYWFTLLCNCGIFYDQRLLSSTSKMFQEPFKRVVLTATHLFNRLPCVLGFKTHKIYSFNFIQISKSQSHFWCTSFVYVHSHNRG